MSKYEELARIIQEAMEETSAAFFVTDIGVEAGPVVIISEEVAYMPPQADVTAIVGFEGGLEGGVHVSAPFHAASGLVEAFLGEPMDGFDATAADGFGELANILAGAVKGRLDDHMSLTPPRVVRAGEAMALPYTRQLAAIKCYFRTEKGPFFVEVFQAVA
ncbi:MAG: chemotaxis protein CheX [Magnetococcales bacterium]|nr:chemotaxis protein CheX [Magnetococcales bacterium]